MGPCIGPHGTKVQWAKGLRRTGGQVDGQVGGRADGRTGGGGGEQADGRADQQQPGAGTQGPGTGPCWICWIYVYIYILVRWTGNTRSVQDMQGMLDVLFSFIA
jgi:hypothetical protein